MSLVNVIEKLKEVENFNEEKFSFRLKNILENDEKLENPKIKKIFFIESHLETIRSLDKSMQACSIESAGKNTKIKFLTNFKNSNLKNLKFPARMNPSYEVYFVLATNGDFVSINHSNLTKVLLSYPNVNFRYANLMELAKGTSAEEFMKSNKLAQSSYQIEHTSDLLRMMILARFGGLYLDHDVWSLLPLNVVNRENFGCPEYSNLISNAVISLNYESGRKIAEMHVK
jgi:hypothetical protein